MKVNCKNCGNEVDRRPSDISPKGNNFCNKSCSASYFNRFKTGNKHPNYKDGGCSYRAIALANKPNECAICRFKESYALEVHHIDHNRANNKLDNLIVICANCHRGLHKGVIAI